MSSNDLSPENPPKKTVAKGRKIMPRKRQLKIVLDTNVLYTGSASDLVRQEVATVVEQTKYPDLEAVWYLPEVVRHERQYQMQKRALELQPGLVKIEKLLGHNLAITSDILLKRVEEAVVRRQNELGLATLRLNCAVVDWERLVLDAAYRRAPFQDGDAEKGFRDAILAESFLQLVADSPKAAQSCRIVLVTADKLLTNAVEGRLSAATNVRVIASLEELRGFINTLVSEVDEEFVALLKERVAKMFFIPKDESTLYYSEHVRDQITKEFEKELAVVPPGAEVRKNGTWRISPPNFSKKIGHRVHWVSRIEIEVEATKSVPDNSGFMYQLVNAGQLMNLSSLGSSWNQYVAQNPLSQPVSPVSLSSALPSPGTSFSSVIGNVEVPRAGWMLSEPDLKDLTPRSYKTIVTHRGVDVYEVLWSVDVTTSVEIRRPSMDSCVHVNTNWETVG
jgi:hypothetical protein